MIRIKITGDVVGNYLPDLAVVLADLGDVHPQAASDFESASSDERLSCRSKSRQCRAG